MQVSNSLVPLTYINNMTCRGFRELRRWLLVISAIVWIQLNPRKAQRIKEERAWLFGCAGGASYDDNSAALHRYVCSSREDITSYWVIDERSRDVEEARSVGEVLHINTVKAFVYGILSRVQVISHGLHDVPTMAYWVSRRSFKVKLGHGLTAFKKTSRRLGMSLRRTNEIYDLVPVASEFERQNKLLWEIEDSKIAITGLARFDRLVNLRCVATVEPGKITYMPTWRDGSRENTAALRSELCNIITSQKVRRILDDNSAHIDFFFHRNLPPEIVSVFKGADKRLFRVSRLGIADLLSRSSLFITDYSSVAWDAIYVDIPVIFYQFDLNDQLRRRGSYWEPQSPLPGHVAYDVDELVAAISGHLSGALPDEAGRSRLNSWQEKAFRYRDSENCRRITDEILARLPPL